METAEGLPGHAGTAVEDPVGTAASLRLACPTLAITRASELFGPLLMTTDPLTTPLRYADGEPHCRTAPGPASNSTSTRCGG